MAEVMEGGCPRCGGNLYEAIHTDDAHLYRCLNCEQGFSPEGDGASADNGAALAKKAPRSEWDKYAQAQGIDPSGYKTKDDLIAALSA